MRCDLDCRRRRSWASQGTLEGRSADSRLALASAERRIGIQSAREAVAWKCGALRAIMVAGTQSNNLCICLFCNVFIRAIDRPYRQSYRQPRATLCRGAVCGEPVIKLLVLHRAAGNALSVEEKARAAPRRQSRSLTAQPLNRPRRSACHVRRVSTRPQLLLRLIDRESRPRPQPI